MTKSDIIASITKQTGIEKSQIQTSIETFFEVVKDSLAQGETIYFRGFGSFHTQKRSQKVARNITKNTTVIVEPYHRPKFKPYKGFVKQIREAVL